MTALGRGVRVITGATGFVGSHFLRRWVVEGARAVALARPDARATAAERVRAALGRAAESLAAPSPAPSVRTLTADLREPSCGVSEAGLLELRASGSSELWHFAASLQYEERHRSAIEAVNVGGTRRALELSRAIGSEWFVYVSTAYTAGTRRGAIPLELPAASASYNNCYEASKAEAERLVADFCEQHGMRYAILRPSIVIGPYCSKSTGGSSTGLYGFVREIARARAALSSLGRPLRLQGDPSTELNLLPIDWFIDDVDELLRDAPERSCIQHHTLDAPPTIRDIGLVLGELLALPGFTISPAFDAPGSPLEQLIARRTAFYAAYLAGSKRFLRARPCARRLAADDLRQYVAAALDRREQPARPVAAAEPERRSRVGR